MRLLRALGAVLWLAALLAHVGAALGQQPVPALSARVTDLTATLAPEQRAALENTLASFEQRKGSQIAVLIVASTAPESIEQYSIRVAEAWQLGRKGVDDGALLLIAKDDRKLRIEVGYGLEGVLPDAIAKRIISETITPAFRQGDFYGGINAGVEQMIGLVEGEPLPPPKSGAASIDTKDWGQAVMVLIVVAVIAGTVLRAIFGRFLGSLAAGGIVGYLAWALLGLLLFALAAGVLAFLNTLLGAMRGGWHSGGRRGRGGYIDHGGWGGGGGGGSGGGFSGGGGGFGGGGASGGW